MSSPNSNNNNNNRNSNTYISRHQRRPPPCRFYNIGQCIYGDNCRFSHDDTISLGNNGRSNSYRNIQNQRQRPQSINNNATTYSNQVCRYYQNGHCRNGDNCPFLHDVETMTNRNYQRSINTKNDNSQNDENESTKQESQSQSQSLPTSPSSTNPNHQNLNTNHDDQNDDEHDCCGICYENIIESKTRFGLLLNCTHVFCLNCIMTWRDQHNVSNHNTTTNNNNNGNQQQPSGFTTTTSRDSNNRPTVTTTMNNGNSISTTIIGGRINANNRNNSNNNDDEITMEELMAQNMARVVMSSMYPGIPLPPAFNPLIPMQSQLSNEEDAFFQNMMSSIGNLMENIANNNNRPTQETTHSCPVCRISSKFVIPSYKFIESKEEKLAYFEQCKQKRGKIKCKHFNGNLGSCPFGKECFYAHFDRNGVDVKERDFRRGAHRHHNGRYNNNGSRISRVGNTRGGRRSGFRVGLVGLPPEIAAFDGADMEEEELDTLHIFSELVEAGLIGGDMSVQGPYSFRQRPNTHFNPDINQARPRQERENDGNNSDDSSHNSLPVLLPRDYDGSSSSDDSIDDSLPPLTIRRTDDDSSSSDDSGDESMPSLSNRTNGNGSVENYESSDGDYNDDDSCVGIPPLQQRRSDEDSSDDEDIYLGMNR